MDEYGESLNGLKVARKIGVTSARIILLQQDFSTELARLLKLAIDGVWRAGAVVGKAGDSA
jgi:hypothetical protein